MSFVSAPELIDTGPTWGCTKRMEIMGKRMCDVHSIEMDIGHVRMQCFAVFC